MEEAEGEEHVIEVEQVTVLALAHGTVVFEFEGFF